MINNEEMTKFVHFMAKEFMKHYNKVFAFDGYKENESILESGYCFYFAYLLNTLIPDSSIVFTGNHYLLFYQDKYYDYRGEIIKLDDKLFLDFYHPIPIESLVFVEDINYDWDLASLSGITDKEKDKFYASIEEDLLNTGRKYLEEKLALNNAPKL